jgi:hypothetical protein
MKNNFSKKILKGKPLDSFANYTKLKLWEKPRRTEQLLLSLVLASGNVQK